MGRTHKDRHDLDEEFLDIDEFESDDESSVELFIVETSSPRKKGKANRKKPKRISRADNREDDDWRDPEDDIMYGFKE